MDRRRFLVGMSAAFPLAAAGCTGPGYSPQSGGGAVAESPTATLEMGAVTDAEIPTEVTYHVESEEGSAERADLMRRIVDGGATVESTRPPLPTDTHVSYRDHVYELSTAVVDTTPARTFSVKVDILEQEVPPERTVRFGDLPAVDRETFAEHGLAEGDVIGVGTALLYTDREAERSALVPESQYDAIVWDDGAKAEWVVDDSYDSPLHSYEYDATVVDSAAEYGRRVRERVAFDLDGLSDAHREIVEAARTNREDGFDGYVVPHDEDPPAAFVSLVDLFRPETQLHALDEEPEGDLSGQYLVRYDDAVHVAGLVVRSERGSGGTTTG